MEVKVDWNKYFGSWTQYSKINNFLSSRYMYSVLRYLDQEYKQNIVYPQKSNVFKAFKLCKPENLKVVILGQDPYFSGNATGLAFANKDTSSLSPSLTIIRNAVEKDTNKLLLDFDPSLENWAKQGVLLLNTSLTVQHGIPNSHKEVWKKFTEFFISFIASYFTGTIFLMWGKEAQDYRIINGFDINSTCYIKKAVHPVFALRRNTEWNCKHFSETNNLIEQNNGKEFCIKW